MDTAQSKRAHGLGPFGIAWDPHIVLYGMYMPEQPRNSSHVSDARIIAVLREQMRTRDVEARRESIFDIQRYAAEQQYYVYLYSTGLTGSWRPYVKNYAPSPSFDYGNRAGRALARSVGDVPRPAARLRARARDGPMTTGSRSPDATSSIPSWPDS